MDWIQSHVPGSSCITPRAFARDTTPLLNPLSWYAIADASEAGTPSDAATRPISAELMCTALACGPAGE